MHARKRLSIALLVVGFLLPGTSYAESNDVPHLGSYIYSDLCTSAQSGDLYGTRITLRRLAGEDLLIYEYTEGGAPRALVAENLVVDPSSGSVQFAVAHPDGGITHISGKFLRNGHALMLKTPLFGDPKRTYTLSRIDNPAAPVPDCK